MHATRLSVCAYRNVFDNEPSMHQLTCHQLVKRLTRFDVHSEVRDKRRLPAWSPARYPSGAKRGAETVAALSCLVLDYDDGTTPEAAIEPWLAWLLVVHSSWSHRPGMPRFRLVLPLGEEVPGPLWERAWLWAAERSAGEPDPNCRDASRLYFLPALPSTDASYLLQVSIAPLLVVREQLDLDTQPGPLSPRRVQPADKQPRRSDYQSRPSWEPAFRLHVANVLGAQVSGTEGSQRAEKITCPSCGRRSVWFIIVPRSAGRAHCHHRNSCDWAGWPDELLPGGAQ